MYNDDMSIVEKARLFAIKAHGAQKYGEFPYEKHLQDVVEIVQKYFDSNDVIMASAWLHDVIEDTDVTFKEVFEEFGRYVARIVFACSDEPGKNRKERHERTYPKLMAAGREAIAVKLADRIANVRHSKTNNHGLFMMYHKEYPDFKKALHLPGELKEMWAVLDVLMAKEVEPYKEKHIAELPKVERT
jgi:(p)ppGpp synthase/HD superfamily hydrolase